MDLQGVETPASVSYEEEFVVNSRGLKLFTCRWSPVGKEIRALVFLCHGYGMECSTYMRGIGVRLAQAGYVVFGLDIEGHGRSEGLRCCINKFSYVINDCVAVFKRLREREGYKSKPRFLYGESMGGLVALLIHRKEPEAWHGAVLVAPMCKISEKLKPPQIVTYILTKLAHFVPTWKLVPIRDIIDTGFKDPLKRQEIRSNVYIYQDKPRLKTALELLNASMDFEQRVTEVTIPFLVLHGEDDSVTDPAISQHLYVKSVSLDKTLKLYPGMWHGLTFGEPQENADLVFGDIINWLDERTTGSAAGSPLRHADLSEFNLQEQLSQVMVGDSDKAKQLPKFHDQSTQLDLHSARLPALST